MYEYRCVMSMAQIELLGIDKPVIVYGRPGKKGKFGKPRAQDVADKARGWEEKYKNGRKPKLDLSGYKIVNE